MIEDDLELATLLQRRLKRNNLDLSLALTPLDGLKLFESNTYDLLILDLSLPQMDGHTICRLVRQVSDIPIIISSARSNLEEKKQAFSYGADDFLPKPYNPDELLLRIDAIMRRLHKTPFKTKQPFEADTAKCELLKNSQPLHLSPAEFDILAYMIAKDGAVVSREELLLNIPSIKYESSLKSIDVIMGRIRQRIGDDPKNPRYLQTVRAKGYKFVNQ